MGDPVTKRNSNGQPPVDKTPSNPRSNSTEPPLSPEAQADKDAADKKLKKDRDKPGAFQAATSPEDIKALEDAQAKADAEADAAAEIQAVKAADEDLAGGPFDPRVNFAFSSTQDVGNSMNKYQGKDTPKKWRGAPSMMNPYALLRLDLQMPYNLSGSDDSFRKYLDRADHPNDQKAGPAKAPTLTWKNPRALDIIEWSQQPGREASPYYWPDFLYCKYFTLIPNNYMLTLRRYSAPVLDNGLVGGPRKVTERDKYVLPAAQAITWIGEETGNKLGEILGFSTTINWRTLEAQVNNVEGNEVGSDALGNPGLTKMNNLLGIMNGSSNFNTISGKGDQQAQHDPYNNGPYANRVYGPVNAITKTMSRGQGLDFKNSMSIKFHYSLDSIGGINPKVAMLDIIANILSLTYNNAAFWGGANRYFPHVPQYPFASKGLQSAWFGGNPGGFMDALGTEVKKAISNISDFLSGIDFKDPNSIMKALGSFAEGGARLGMAHLQAGHRPNIVAMRALLTGEAVGEWHLTVGNPMNPIARIGNLIVTDTKYEFSEQLGPEDFPEELIVTINLDHGKPRDKGDIESMFNNGQGRMYYPYKGKTEPWNTSSSTRNSKIDTSWGKGQAVDKQTLNNATNQKDRTSRGYVPFDANDTDIEYLSTLDASGKIPDGDSVDFVGRRIYGSAANTGDMKAAIDLVNKMSLQDTIEVDGDKETRPHNSKGEITGPDGKPALGADGKPEIVPVERR